MDYCIRRRDNPSPCMSLGNPPASHTRRTHSDFPMLAPRGCLFQSSSKCREAFGGVLAVLGEKQPFGFGSRISTQLPQRLPHNMQSLQPEFLLETGLVLELHKLPQFPPHNMPLT